MKPEIITTVDDLPKEVIETIKKGNKIKAIKQLRSHSDLELANAKVLVDAAARRYAPPPTYHSLVDPRGRPASLMLLLLLLLSTLAAYSYFSA